ncbi:MAG TPA: nucleotidyltransferase family protein [Caldisericia bacterium]|nr:nucleotidyltransferase family protein [Caldisericia bacterium]
MKAIVLAAGYATRLYPLTLNKAKALLPLAGKPILNYLMDELDKLPLLDEVFIVSNDRFAQDFDAWKKAQNYRVRITVVNDGTKSDETKLGAIGDMELVIRKYLLNEDLLVIAGDTYFTFKLIDFYHFFERCQRDCLLVKEINDNKQLQRMGVVEIDSRNQIIGFEEKPQVPKSNKASFAGYIYLQSTLPLIKNYLSKGLNPDAPGNFPAWLYKIKEVYAYSFNGDCFDIGTPESYQEVDAIVKKNFA